MYHRMIALRSDLFENHSTYWIWNFFAYHMMLIYDTFFELQAFKVLELFSLFPFSQLNGFWPYLLYWRNCFPCCWDLVFLGNESLVCRHIEPFLKIIWRDLQKLDYLNFESTTVPMHIIFMKEYFCFLNHLFFSWGSTFLNQTLYHFSIFLRL